MALFINLRKPWGAGNEIKCFVACVCGLWHDNWWGKKSFARKIFVCVLNNFFYLWKHEGKIIFWGRSGDFYLFFSFFGNRVKSLSSCVKQGFFFHVWKQVNKNIFKSKIRCIFNWNNNIIKKSLFHTNSVVETTSLTVVTVVAVLSPPTPPPPPPPQDIKVI